MRLIALILCLLIAQPALAQPDLKSLLKKLGGQPCASGALTCVTLKVAKDHRANDPKATLDISFAVNLATKRSKGVLFYVVGGPGYSGLLAADSYLSAFDANLTENMDIVFFDQRGIGGASGLTCPNAQAVFDTAEMPLNDSGTAAQTAQTYVKNCLSELKAPELLAVVDTDQAIRDLEQFRLAIGAPRVWIYGESYGTQFAQQYATAFPRAIKGVILDGVVDLNLSFEGFSDRYTSSAERILARLFDACNVVAGCATDMGGSAAAAYDTLSARLKSKPARVQFPLPDGSLKPRSFSAGALESNAFYALYGPDDRASFLRALAAAAHGALVPMQRLSDANLTIDPATESEIADPSWFGAAYYAVTCSDYSDEGATPGAKVALILAQAKAFAPKAPRLLHDYYAERLVCAYWPKSGPATRPEPFAGGDYPTLVMNGTMDPITPVTMAYSVYHHVKNGSIVVMQGGPHVIWGRGFACPDKIVADLMFDGKTPDAAVQVCTQDFIGSYQALTDPSAGPLALLHGLKAEIDLSDLSGFGGGDPVSAACDFGGSITASAAKNATAYAFAACAMWPGLVIDGSGKDVPDQGLSLKLQVSGSHTGDLTYHTSAVTEAATLDGTYDGKPALDLADLAP